MSQKRNPSRGALIADFQEDRWAVGDQRELGPDG
jgi:hypothetical protein